VNVRVIPEFDQETRAWSAVCPELPGCASAGDTKDEALENIRDAIELYLSPDEPVPADAMVVELTV
jgi:predicted RNase H-like HicB family nuclease